jgi:hypothetical protein
MGGGVEINGRPLLAHRTSPLARRSWRVYFRDASGVVS